MQACRHDMQTRYKLSYIYKRPSPYGAEGVGAGEDQGGQGTTISYCKVKAMSLVDSSCELGLGLRLVVLESGHPRLWHVYSNFRSV